jgi:hypothetical protein
VNNFCLHSESGGFLSTVSLCGDFVAKILVFGLKKAEKSWVYEKKLSFGGLSA